MNGNAQGGGQVSRALAEAGARAQPIGAKDVGRQVTVAQAKPGRAVEPLELRERLMAIPAQPPAPADRSEVGERVERRIDVGTDPQPVELVVIARIDDDG
jgi:hypothetical protein